MSPLQKMIKSTTKHKPDNHFPAGQQLNLISPAKSESDFVVFLVNLSLLILFFGACSNEYQDDDLEKFTGRWKLYIVESKADSLSGWEPRQDHYKNRQGFIIYDGRGGMGVHHVPEAYEKYQLEGKGGIDSLTMNDLQHLAGNFVYFGKYHVIDSLKIIEHHIESANLPIMWGKTAKRKYTFSGDTLFLNPVADRYPKIRLKWLKLVD